MELLSVDDITYLITRNLRRGFVAGVIFSGVLLGMKKSLKYVTINLNTKEND